MNLEDMLSETRQRKRLRGAAHRCNLSKSESTEQEPSVGVGQGWEAMAGGLRSSDVRGGSLQNITAAR